MDRKSCVVCLIILFLFCSIAQATNYSMRYNAQTGRGDWIIADSSIYSVVDEVYGAGWDGRTDEGASLNAIYDKIETVVGGGAPGGADTQVQFNDGGAFSGESTFIYNKALNSLSIDRIVIGPGVADYLMPTTRGAANTYLRDNGAGAVTFSALSGIGPANFTPNADFGDINTGAGGELRFGADSIDDSHLNWGSMTYLGEEGESLVTAYAAVGTFESGDTFICYEAGVGARECDYDDMPAGGSGDLLADGTVPMTANWAMGDFQMTMGGLVVDMDGSADQMQINQTAVAGTENQPLIFINDDRVGLTVNEDDEAALRIDSEGAYAIWVEDGKVKFSNNLEAAGIVMNSGKRIQGSNYTTDWNIEGSTTQDQLYWQIGAAYGRQLIIGDTACYDQDFGHAVQTNPTIYAQSVTCPDTLNDEWISITHDQTDGVVDVGSGSIKFLDAILGDTLSASELVSTNASKELVSLAVATYPSLTELSYVKGVSSAIQTQMNLKAPSDSPTFTTAFTATGLVAFADLGTDIITGATAVGTFASGDTFLCQEAGVGVRECDYDDLPSGGSGGGFAWQLDPKSAKLPATNPMGIDAGNLQWRGLFDDTTDECARWQGVLTPYTSGLDIDIVYSLETTSTSDIVELEVYVMCGKSDADMDTDSFDSVNNLSSGSVSTTAGHQAKLTATLSNDDSCAEDDLIIIKICRDADDTDTTADDVEFRGASLHE